MKSLLNTEKWQQAKYNGTRLIKLCEDNKLLIEKAKAVLEIDDSKMTKLVDYLR